MKRLIGLFCYASFFMLTTMTTSAFMASASAYSGGYFDDGLYDDDWYVDYYEPPTDSPRMSSQDGNQDQDKLREYDAGQMYEGAEESGIFNY
ncbi:MAG: hypothetical protein A4E19_20025 [Nitrospira sp. SG-bin1]|nr:MAG: hypothetical protein A4E19_20025 [Nitrospira sp. SG-bin1]